MLITGLDIITKTAPVSSPLFDAGLDFKESRNFTSEQSEKLDEIKHLLFQANALSFDLNGVLEKIKKFFYIKELFLKFEDEYHEILSEQVSEKLKLSARNSEFSAKTLEVGLAFYIANTTEDKETQIQKNIEGFNLLKNLVDNYWKQVGHQYEQLAYNLAERVYHITPNSPLEETLKNVQQECLIAIFTGINKFDKTHETLKKENYKLDNLSDLYEADFYAWTQEQASSLREKVWSLIDIPNLVEEIESLGRQERQELTNRLGVLLGHLLKWEFQTDSRSKSWFSTIREQRKKINRLLKDSPSLKPYLPEALQHAYEDGLELAVRETSLGYGSFPKECPYELEKVLDISFLPGLKSELDFE